MPAMIENMFSVLETPWHGLGEILDGPPTIEEGIKLAGLDWDVSLLPLVTKTGIDAPANAVCRQVGDQTKVLGVVGPRYQPLQNRDAFSWFNPFIETGEVALETAGSLDEGKRIWVMAKINRDPSEIVKGDEVLKYLMLSNSHDGTLAIRVGYTPIRIVCANTLAMAHGSNASKLVRVRHTKSSKMALDKLHEVMNNIDAEFEATADQFRFLASRMFNQADVRKYVKAVLGNEKVEENDLPTRTKNTINSIVDLIDAGRGQDEGSVRHTWWHAYNGFNEYLNYQASRNANNRMSSLWFGANGNMNTKALELAIDFAQSA